MLTRFLLPTLVTAFFLSVAVGTPAHAAAFKSGNDLFQDCKASSNSFTQGVCIGFAIGVADAMEAARPVNGMVAGFRACFPAQVTAGQVTDVAVSFLTRHPEWRHLAASSLVAGALAEAFPCR